MIHLDGSMGEGGGQIIRTAVSLAAITGTTVEIANIRAKRSKPGLQAQHLTAVRAAGMLCNAKIYGAELGSAYIHFVPGAASDSARPSNAPGDWVSDLVFDVGAARSGASAGASGLVMQTILVPLSCLSGAKTENSSASPNRVMSHPSEEIVSQNRVQILGGTHVPMSPTSDYLEAVYLPMLRRMGVHWEMETLRAGFYPKGGGEVSLVMNGGGLTTSLDLVERGRLQRLSAYITTSQLPEHVASRAEDLIRKELKGFGVPLQIEKRDLESNGPGAAVCLVAEYPQGRGGWVALGERGKPMERVATEAIRSFLKWHASGATVDEHLADQLVLPCALIPTESRWITPETTEHLRTVLEVVGRFLPIEYTLAEREDGTCMVTMRGAVPSDATYQA